MYCCSQRLLWKGDLEAILEVRVVDVLGVILGEIIRISREPSNPQVLL